jgi:hypothetical protein
MMAEGFGNIDGEASLWKEPSPFEILGKDIRTNLIIQEFVEVSRTSKDVSTRLRSDAIKSVLATFDKSIDTEPPVRAAIMRPITTTGVTQVSATGVYLPAFTGGGGNTTSFHFQIDDPISAGRGFITGDNFGIDLVYTEPSTSARFGELDDFFIFLIPDVDIDDDGLYPLIQSGQYNGIAEQALTLSNISDTINKDKNAKFAVTFQQHFITDDPTIIIGTAVAKYNRLFTDRTIPNVKIYRSAKPYSIFDNKIRSNDVLTTGGVSVNDETRKLSLTALVPTGQPELKYVALAYEEEILLAFNDFVAGDEFYINFTDAAEREIINQLPTPSSFGSQSFPDELRFALTNLSPESVTLEATLDGETLTQVVQGNDGIPLNIANYTHTFVFDELDPNTNYQLSFRALPSVGSEFVASSFGIANATTLILPTDPPIVVEKEVLTDPIVAVYTVTNPNDFAVRLKIRIDGFESNSELFAANQTRDVGAIAIGEQQGIEEGVEYDIDFRFITTEFINNWFSDYTAVQTLLIAQLTAPTYDAANSSTTDSTVSLRWNNPNNVATDIEVTLRTVPFTSSGGQTVVETKSVPIGANTFATVVFSNNINPLQFYDSKAKLLTKGFRLDSDEVNSTPAIQTTQATTVRPFLTLNSRTTNSLIVDFRNDDGQTADIYYNTTGSPNVGDPTISQVSSGATQQRTISGLASGAEVTVFARAKATNELISATRELTARTLLQQQQPNFGTSSVTETTITVSYGNPNAVDGNIRVRLNKLLAGGGKTFVEDKFLTIDANGNNNADPFVFTGLDQNSNYELEAKFLLDDYKLESTTRVNNLSTTQFKSQNPVVVINDITPTSVNFTMTNQDNRGAEFIYGVAFPLGQHPEATVGAFGSLTRGISSLDSDTPYVLQVQAIADDYSPSDVVELPFKTDPAPVPTQWVFRSATTPNETLARGFVANACPTSADNLTYLNGQINPSTKAFGYIVAVTSSSTDGLGNLIECTTHHYEAQ